MLEHFDDLVTDRRLTLSGVVRHLTELEGASPRTEPMLFGEYRAMASGGTSGRRGIFVYGRAEWTEVLAGLARLERLLRLRSAAASPPLRVDLPRTTPFI